MKQEPSLLKRDIEGFIVPFFYLRNILQFLGLTISSYYGYISLTVGCCMGKICL